MSVSTPSGGAGTTLVLGTRFVRGLATTGTSAAKLLWLVVSGMGSIVTGAVLLGRGRKVRAGETLET